MTKMESDEYTSSKADYVNTSVFSIASLTREDTEPHLRFGKHVFPVETGLRLKKILVIVIAVIVAVLALAVIIPFVTRGSDDDTDSDAWTLWSGWGECSLTCGGGTQNRTRTCQPEGATCVGDASEQQNCNLQDCPDSDAWTLWSEWEECSLTCGEGTQNRTRACQPEGATCEGDVSEQQACNIENCPDSIAPWGTWGQWASCNATCGQGTTSRSRECSKTGSSSNECVGESQETASCNKGACPGEVAFWDEWQSWSACDVTCGQGTQSRYRQCVRSSNTTGQCIGDAKEVTLCDTVACQVYGSWTTWSGWGSCGVTCDGGTQTRTRTCLKEAASDIDCAGDVAMTQSCNSWSCPDCSRQCDYGTLNAACDTCICSGTNITVRTQTSSNKPLMDVYAYAASAPTTLVATSDGGGSLTLTTLCVGDEIILSKEGFLETNIVMETTSVQATLEHIVYPRLVTSPVSKYRLEAGDARFCCMAEAYPNVTYYEWFKDGIVISSSFDPKQTELELLNLTVADSGLYRCRANSPVGAVYSQEATLNVQKTANDFCLNAIEDKVISLPRDCVQQETNETTYNIGTCAPKPCTNKTDSETSCSDTDYACCSASAYTIVTIQCSDYELTIPVVQACACASCSLTPLSISGVALGGTTNIPLRRGQVFVNGELKSYTSSGGLFSVSVPTSPDYQSVTLKFVDVLDKIFHDMVKVINIPGASTDNIYISVKMIEKPEPVVLQSGVENTLYGGGQNATNSSAALTQIIIPPDSFYYDNGTKYEGSVSVIFTYLLPSDAEGFEAIPGEFQFVNGNGEMSQLETLGVFNLQLFDDKDNELTVSEPIDVTLAGNLGGVDQETGEAVQLWGMNDITGYWELLPFLQSKRRKRRQGNYLIGQINTDDYDWRNCDIYLQKIECFINPGVYEDNSLNTLVSRTNLKLTYLYTSLREGRTTARFTHFEYTGPECTAIDCSGRDALMQMQISTGTGSSVLSATNPTPASTHQTDAVSGGVNISMRYDNLNIFDNIATCKTESLTANSARLSFYKKNPNDDVYTFHFYGQTPTDELDEKSWCRSDGKGGTQACALKVRLVGTFPKNSTKVVVRSSMGLSKTEYNGFVVGIRQASPNSDGYACVPYRCTTEINNKLDETKLTIFVATNGNNCTVHSHNPNITVKNQYKREQMRLTVTKTYEDNSFNIFGIYKKEHQTFCEKDCRTIVPNSVNTQCKDSNMPPVVTFYCQ